MRAYSYSVADTAARRFTLPGSTAAWMVIGLCVACSLGFWLAS